MKLDLQLDAARKLGVKTADIFIEKASVIRHDRPVLAKALVALEKGDTLACYKLDRSAAASCTSPSCWRTWKSAAYTS
jgi:DNA invertase Pin-like site-specific DNA recombinase